MSQGSQTRGESVRELSEEEKAKLAADVNVVSDFKQNKLELEAKKNWDLFYKRNTTKFFKDRHWTTREFEELISHNSDGDKVDTENFKKKLLSIYKCYFHHAVRNCQY